jgi:organic hydroperoxide reductase OsmC/OhrA
MLAAAVASCMSVMVAKEMVKAGLKDKQIKMESQLTLEEKEHRWEITGVPLNITADVPEIHIKKFEHVVGSAKAKCPTTHALKVPVKVSVKEQLGKIVAA